MTLMPTPIQIEELLNAYYEQERAPVPEASQIIQLSAESELMLELAARGESPPDPEDEDEKAPFTLGELSAIGAGIAAGVVACAGFAILSSWPSILAIFLGSLGVIVLFAGGVAYLSRSRFRVGIALAPTILAVAIVSAWSLSDFRRVMLSTFPNWFLDTAVETAVLTENGRLVSTGCDILSSRRNGPNLILDSIHKRPEIAKVCIDKIEDPQKKAQMSGILINRWEEELLSGEFETACRYLGHFEYLASIHENASLRLSSIALRVESAKIRDCVMDHLKKTYPTPESMVAEWTEELNEVGENTGRRFVQALIDSWRVEREDLKHTNFEPTETMMNFRLKLACSYIREEGEESEVVGWLPGILQQSKDGYCAAAVNAPAVVDTCEAYDGKNVRAFCDELVKDTLPWAIRDASSLIHRAIRWGLDPDQFERYERSGSQYRDGTREALARVGGSGVSRLAKDELERQASDAGLFQYVNLSPLMQPMSDSEIDQGMDQAFGKVQGQTPEELAATLGLDWDELDREQRKQLAQLVKEVEMDPEKRKKIMKDLKRAQKKKRRGKKGRRKR